MKDTLLLVVNRTVLSYISKQPDPVYKKGSLRDSSSSLLYRENIEELSWLKNLKVDLFSSQMRVKPSPKQVEIIPKHRNR